MKFIEYLVNVLLREAERRHESECLFDSALSKSEAHKHPLISNVLLGLHSRLLTQLDASEHAPASHVLDVLLQRCLSGELVDQETLLVDLFDLVLVDDVQHTDGGCNAQQVAAVGVEDEFLGLGE